MPMPMSMSTHVNTNINADVSVKNERNGKGPSPLVVRIFDEKKCFFLSDYVAWLWFKESIKNVFKAQS